MKGDRHVRIQWILYEQPLDQGGGYRFYFSLTQGNCWKMLYWVTDHKIHGFSMSIKFSFWHYCRLFYWPLFWERGVATYYRFVEFFHQIPWVFAKILELFKTNLEFFHRPWRDSEILRKIRENPKKTKKILVLRAIVVLCLF